MIYTTSISIPANTAITAPVKEILRVTQGVVYQLDMEFPAGCAGLSKLYIKQGSNQVWPSPPDKTFASNDFTISFPETYLLSEPPFQFEIYGYNEDEQWPHTLKVMIGLVSQKIFMARFLPSVQVEIWSEMLAEMEAEKERVRQEILEQPFDFVS